MGQLGLGPSEGSNVGRLDHDLAGVDWEPYGVLWMEKRVVPHHDEILNAFPTTHISSLTYPPLPLPTYISSLTYAHGCPYLRSSLLLPMHISSLNEPS